MDQKCFEVGKEILPDTLSGVVSVTAPDNGRAPPSLQQIIHTPTHRTPAHPLYYPSLTRDEKGSLPPPYRGMGVRGWVTEKGPM